MNIIRKGGKNENPENLHAQVHLPVDPSMTDYIYDIIFMIDY